MTKNERERQIATFQAIVLRIEMKRKTSSEDRQQKYLALAKIEELYQVIPNSISWVEENRKLWATCNGKCNPIFMKYDCDCPLHGWSENRSPL